METAWQLKMLQHFVKYFLKINLHLKGNEKKV